MPDREPIRCVSTTGQATATLNRDSAITAALDRLVRYIGEARSAGRLERISIRSYASPDGANRANELLSERRADSLSSWIVRHSSVSASLIDRQAAGIAWDELRAQVASAF